MSMGFSQETQEKKTVDRTRPFHACIKERWPLTKKGSSKETYHVSLDLKGSDVFFSPGDSIGVYAQNDPDYVNALITALKVSGDEPIIDARSNQTLTLSEFLTNKANLVRTNSSLLKVLSEQTSDFTRLLEPQNKADLALFLSENEPIDLLLENSIDPQEFCNNLSPLLPRFYSVASSQKVFPNEVHLTVALTSFLHKGQKRFGVASRFLCNIAQEGTTPVPIYVQKAHSFLLPQESATAIIMVGPGTGVAPYRAFLQERLHIGAQGKNWLFFGERNKETDFYYEEFFTPLSQDNKLKLDLAFSRDGTEKTYVQHKMEENALELYRWLEEGAHFYVCGDAKNMAKDVEATLQRIIKTWGFK
jgi:sulfite reductase (NADPH) flavoprotein alpha-component